MNCGAELKRRKSPTSTAAMLAESQAIPRRHCSAATSGSNRLASIHSWIARSSRGTAFLGGALGAEVVGEDELMKAITKADHS